MKKAEFLLTLALVVAITMVFSVTLVFAEESCPDNHWCEVHYFVAPDSWRGVEAMDWPNQDLRMIIEGQEYSPWPSYNPNNAWLPLPDNLPAGTVIEVYTTDGSARQTLVTQELDVDPVYGEVCGEVNNPPANYELYLQVWGDSWGSQEVLSTNGLVNGDFCFSRAIQPGEAGVRQRVGTRD